MRPGFPLQTEKSAMTDKKSELQPSDDVPGMARLTTHTSEGIRAEHIDPGERKLAKTRQEQLADRLVATCAKIENEKHLLTAVMDALPVGVSIVDINGGVIRTNSAFERIWGGPTPETRSVEDYAAYIAYWADTGALVAPEEWASAIAVRKGEAAAGQLMRLRRFDGSEIFVINSASPVRDSEGTVIGSAVAIQDVTELKRTELALHESEGRLRLFIEHAPAALAMFDRDMRYLCVSNRWLSDYGMEGRDLLGQTHYEIFPETPAHWQEAHRRGLAGEVVRVETDCLQRPDGTEQLLRWEIHPWHNASGAVGGIVIFTEDISERRRMERALLKEQEDLARAQQVGSIGSWTLDVRRNVLTWSDENHRIFGIPKGTPLSYESFLATIHPEDRAKVDAEWQAALVSGKPYDTEHRIVVDGRVKWIHEKAYLEFDENGVLAGGFGISQDVSESKLAEEALRKSEERHRLLAETMLQGVVHQDADGRVIAMNTAAEEILGKDRERFLNSTSDDVDHHTIRENGEYFPGMEHPSMVALSTGQPVQDVIMGVFNPKRAAYRWIRIDAVPVFSQGAERPSEVYTVFEDITDRKEAEATLRKNERTMRALINSANESIWLFGLDGEILAANDTAARRMGATVEEVVGKKWQGLVPEDLRISRAERIDEVVRTGLPLCFEDRRAGMLFEHNAYPVREENGVITAVAFFSSDITERRLADEILKQSQNQLRALNNELEQRIEQRTLELQEAQAKVLHAEKLSAIGKLSASIAHEFNNPLQGIQAVLRGLKKRATMEPEDRELLTEAIEESDRMKDLIRSLQEFNSPSTGRKRLVDVHKTIDSLLLLYKSDFKSKRISIVLDYAEFLPQVEAVSDQIKQVFLNLLTNAADACHRPGGVITVSTRKEDENRVAVTIKDTGVGIHPADRELIFQPFYTTKSQVKGTGLGLSVSFGIVKNHHGEIRVESEPGKGSAFTVVLPVNSRDAVA